jgi:hypothetical protein
MARPTPEGSQVEDHFGWGGHVQSPDRLGHVNLDRRVVRFQPVGGGSWCGQRNCRLGRSQLSSS